MNIMVVTPNQLPGPQHATWGDDNIWLRSEPSGLKSLAVDVLLLFPGLSKEQRELAVERTRAVRGSQIYEVVKVL